MTDPQWLLWARKLEAVSQNGLRTPYGSRDPIDLERYKEVQQIAAEIVEHHSDLPTEKLIGLFEGQSGYTTPKVSVRAAIFDGPNILLVREIHSGLWTTPGGYAEVNETPSEAVEREVLEESGYEVKARRLLAVRNRMRLPDESIRFFNFYILYFDCEPTGKVQEPSPLETSEAAFHPLDDLPLTIRFDGPFTEEQRRAATRQHYGRLFELHNNPDLAPDFD